MLRKTYAPWIILVAAIIALLSIHPATPATSISQSTLPACTHEDGSGQALCTWDAQIQGNNMGTDVVAGDCSIDTVGTLQAQTYCMQLWAMDERTTHNGDGSISTTAKGSVLVDDCLTIEFEASHDKAIRMQLDNEGWNLTECFKAHIE